MKNPRGGLNPIFPKIPYHPTVAAAVKPCRDLCLGLILARTRAARMTPYDAYRVWLARCHRPVLQLAGAEVAGNLARCILSKSYVSPGIHLA